MRLLSPLDRSVMLSWSRRGRSRSVPRPRSECHRVNWELCCDPFHDNNRDYLSPPTFSKVRNGFQCITVSTLRLNPVRLKFNNWVTNIPFPLVYTRWTEYVNNPLVYSTLPRNSCNYSTRSQTTTVVPRIVTTIDVSKDGGWLMCG